MNKNAPIVDLVPVTERVRWWWSGWLVGVLCGLWGGWVLSWIGRGIAWVIWS